MSRPTNACIIYVYGQLDGEYAKLGKTRNRAELRMREHETRGPTRVQMKPLILLYGHDSDEKALKRYWKDILADNGEEWVRPVEKFRAWLRFMKQQAYVTDKFDELDKMDFVDSRHWLPCARNAFDQAQGRLNFSSDPWSDLDLNEEGDGDFYTHEAIIEAARQTMGRIDLDPASCRKANSAVKAIRFFSALQDGLTQQWEGFVWLNPPFGQWDLWGPKLLTELSSGRVEQACVLMPSRATTAKQNHNLIQKSSAVVIPNGRQKFWGPKATTPDEGHFIFYFGNQLDNFANAFGSIGQVFLSRLTPMDTRDGKRRNRLLGAAA